jgi:hypothetical protein
MNTKCNRFLILLQGADEEKCILDAFSQKNVAFHYLI